MLFAKILLFEILFKFLTIEKRQNWILKFSVFRAEQARHLQWIFVSRVFFLGEQKLSPFILSTRCVVCGILAFLTISSSFDVMRRLWMDERPRFEISESSSFALIVPNFSLPFRLILLVVILHFSIMSSISCNDVNSQQRWIRVLSFEIWGKTWRPTRWGIWLDERQPFDFFCYAKYLVINFVKF